MMVKDFRKKYYLLILLSGVALTLAGCSGPTKETAKVQTTAAAGTDMTSPETSAAAQAETAGADVQAVPETEAADTAATGEIKKTAEKDESVRVLSGTVTEAGTSTVTVVSDRYPGGVTFYRQDTATQFENGLLLDQEITIFYQGEIKDGDTDEVTVLLIRDKRDNDHECQAAMLSGTIAGIGMSVVTIETADGKCVSFEQDPKPVNLTNGPLEGDKVTILYSYSDEGGDGGVVPELIR